MPFNTYSFPGFRGFMPPLRPEERAPKALRKAAAQSPTARRAAPISRPYQATLACRSWLRSSMGKLKAAAELFEGRHFDREVIILCVRWYLRFKLSLRDLVEMMAERGLSMAHTTIMRWMQRYAPEFEKRWRRFTQAVGQSWRVDETYVKIRGEWCYL